MKDQTRNFSVKISVTLLNDKIVLFLKKKTSCFALNNTLYKSIYCTSFQGCMIQLYSLGQDLNSILHIKIIETWNSKRSEKPLSKKRKKIKKNLKRIRRILKDQEEYI